MKLKTVFDKEFRRFGHVLEGYDFSELLKTLDATTEKPDDKVIYIPSDPALEALPVFTELRDRAFGGIPIQVGYVNGFNVKLNCLEYHRGSEISIPSDDIILLLAKLEDVENDTIDSSIVQAFSVPKGTGIIYYETSMHYSPARPGSPFRDIIVLPRDTNTALPKINCGNKEDRLLRARNKWLYAHADTTEAKEGAVVGITGKNINVETDLDL